VQPGSRGNHRSLMAGTRCKKDSTGQSQLITIIELTFVMHQWCSDHG